MPALAVTAPFPIVAVLGLRRPTLVIARSVLAACTPDELRAILAHEQGHIDRRDNLRRLLLAVSPDVVAWLPASDRLFAEWSSAAEEAADDDAARAGAAGRLHLASALMKVARLATGHAAADVMPASALYCGHNLDGRVRRLLEPPCAASRGAGDRPPLTRIAQPSPPRPSSPPWRCKASTRSLRQRYGHFRRHLFYWSNDLPHEDQTAPSAVYRALPNRSIDR